MALEQLPNRHGAESSPQWLDTDWLLCQFSAERSKAVQVYCKFVIAGRGVPSLLLEPRHQLLLGEDACVARYQQYQDNEVLREVSMAQRISVALPLDEYRIRHSNRGEAMAQAYLTGAYTMAEIDHFGVHYMTVSWAVQKYKSDQKKMLEC